MAQRMRSRRAGFRSHVKGRLRLLAGLTAGLVAYPLFSLLNAGAALSLALAWDVGSAVYLALSCVMMFRSTPAHIAQRARELDISLGEIVLLTLAAVGFSLFAAARVLGEATGRSDMAALLHSGAGIATIMLSWFMVHMLFSIHYAHEFYVEKASQERKALGGLNFPGRGAPDYWDFLYFAAVVAMTCQVSDVTIDRREMRHLVTAHGIISFFLNTVIVALAVSIAANLI
ncbi:DUF1345 domain-containing protein [Dongia sp.]|uniref:DUF1345 domain-containing protein n=1 Tax=Dongia sp. TaxID=1977262 RepID=UPI0035AF5212